MTTPIAIPASALRSAFAVLAKLIPNRSTLPVLGHIRIERVENRVRLSATDLDRWVTFTHRSEPDPLTPLARTLAALRWRREAGALLVPKSALQAALKAVDKDGTVTFTLRPPTANSSVAAGKQESAAPPIVTLSYPLGGTIVNTPVESLPSADFPPEPSARPAHACVLDASARAALVEAGQFSSTDQTRHVLNGIYLETRWGDKASPPVVVATDGRRLYRRGVPAAAALGVNCIIPTGVVNLLGTPALLAHDWQWSTDRKVEFLSITAGPWKLVGRLIDGNFPNYRQVIPDQSATTAALGESTHRQLVGILGKLPPPPKGRASTEAVTLRFHPDRLGIEDPHSKASLVVPGVACAGRSKVISLNRFFLRELLATGPGTFHLIDAKSPLRYDTTTNAVHVLMPMRVA